MDNQTLLRPATDIARLLRDKALSSRELTGALLARIEQVNPALTAVVALRPEQALAEAAAADQAAARGGDLGPLHGVPMTVKDAFDVAGLPTTWGNPAFAGHVAAADATVVRRLRRAGAVVAGKTNVAFMLGDFGQTANGLHGVTANPWDPTRTPGGSSGGSAAAVAAGLSFLDYGSDLVGSIRLPASYCGPYGLRPSVGTVPLTGFQPPGPPAAPSDMTYLSALGPLARSAGDLRAALAVTAGPEGPAARAYTWALAPPRRTRLRDFRVGVVLDHPQAAVSGEVAAALSGAVDALARAGATVVEGWPAGVDPVAEAASFGFHVRLFFAYQQPGDDLPPFAEVVEQERRRMAARAPGAPTSRTSTCSCARPASRPPSPTTPGPSRTAPSPPPGASGPTPTRSSGWPTRRCPACRRWPPRSGGHQAASPSAPRSSAPSTRTTRRSPSPACWAR
jgi:amidase